MVQARTRLKTSKRLHLESLHKLTIFSRKSSCHNWLYRTADCNFSLKVVNSAQEDTRQKPDTPGILNHAIVCGVERRNTLNGYLLGIRVAG